MTYKKKSAQPKGIPDANVIQYFYFLFFCIGVSHNFGNEDKTSNLC